mmetsp:Transcript_34732/g.48484  ORF Transcript_34732/g.48484 Transcript_34732/m.48484 type:complete len:592 (+) Transcript_34732:173-1948(+)
MQERLLRFDSLNYGDMAMKRHNDRDTNPNKESPSSSKQARDSLPAEFDAKQRSQGTDLKEHLQKPISLRELGYQAEGYKVQKLPIPKTSSLVLAFEMIFRWKGSIWKATWKQLLIFLFCYYSVSVSYRFFMTSDQKEYFEKLSFNISYYLSHGTIPLAFVLGFYVQQVYTRWMDMWSTLGWIDLLALRVSSTIRIPLHMRKRRRPNRSSPAPDSTQKGKRNNVQDRGAASSFERKYQGEEAELEKQRANMERELYLHQFTILRYCNLVYAMIARACSKKMLALYPDMRGLITDGLLTKEELDTMERISEKDLPHQSDWWLPIAWANDIVQDCYEQGWISSPQELEAVRGQLLAFRSTLAHMLDFTLVTIPLIYVQLAHVSVYIYFALVVIGRAQFLDTSKGYEGNGIDYYFPFFSVLEFVIFAGWLQVAAKMLDPYGLRSDEESFDLIWVLHRNVEVGNTIIGPVKKNRPEMVLTTPLTGPGSERKKKKKKKKSKWKKKRGSKKAGSSINQRTVDVTGRTVFPFRFNDEQRHVTLLHKGDLSHEARSVFLNPYAITSDEDGDFSGSINNDSPSQNLHDVGHMRRRAKTDGT